MPMLELRNAIKERPRNKDETWRFLTEMGNIDSNVMLKRSYDGIKDAWLNQPCFVVGAGYDLRDFIENVGWDFLNDKHTIGMNHVIEDYDKFEWFLFLDKRFLVNTTYNMSQFKGRVFAHCSTGYKPEDRITIFHTSVDAPTHQVQDGLYSGNLSGLCALNLAIISGANPIYLLGCGIGKGATEKSYHYKDTYTGERKEAAIFAKFQRVMRLYKSYAQYNDRIIQVTTGTEPTAIQRKMRAVELLKDKPSLQWTGAKPRIVHISFSNDITKHADITRYIIKECYGEHSLIAQNQAIPKADLYITEHFLSTDKFVNRFPYKEKTINIVHTVNCIPQGPFKRNIALTNAWKKILEQHFVKNITMIHGGIDLSQYANIIPDYSKLVFGRITRYSAGKIHPAWNEMVQGILNAEPTTKCVMYTQLDSLNNRPILFHPGMIYDKSCQIDMFKGDFLKNLSIYVHMNGSFKETLSFAVIEAMATGLPIVYLDEKTGVLDEITGNTQIKCNSVDDVTRAILSLLHDKKSRILYGTKAKEQAKKFDKNIMLAKFDREIKQCIA